MGTYRVEQYRVVHEGRDFHFVSYEARPANERRGEEAFPPMWFLMNAGRRVPVIPHTPGEPFEELEPRFRAWLDEHVFAALASADQAVRSA
jgi:hypothetical protein